MLLFGIFVRRSVICFYAFKLGFIVDKKLKIVITWPQIVVWVSTSDIKSC